MRESVMRGVYRVAVWLLLPFVFGYFWWRGRREPGYRRRWCERLGWIDALPQSAFWLHAASVGEVALAVPLVRQLAARAPGRPIIVTTFTPTGAEQVRAKLGDVAAHCYLPLDTASAARRFVRRLQPCCGIIIETELWPNLLHETTRAGVPVMIANASISARSAARYQKPWLAALMRPALAGLAGVAAADQACARRFEALGAPAERVRVTGNLKYDITPDPSLPDTAAALRREWQAEHRPVWVAASTHDGEQAIVLQAHRQLRAQGHNALLVLAPRHPQRFDDVRELLADQGWRFAARAAGDAVDDDTEVVLGDTLGEVPMFYALADMAFVGGSLTPGVGGHNMLEAAALARPVIVGAHTQQWQEITDALAAAGALRVAGDADALTHGLQAWVTDAEARRVAGEAASECFEARRGAMAALFALIEDVVCL